MDAIGFALEHFDAIGRYRTTDENLPIDVTGTLPDGTPINGHLDLKLLLNGKKDQFSRCLTEKLLTYALGRGLEVYDKRSIDRILEILAKDGYRFSTLVVEIVKSEPFRLRRGKEETQ